VFNPRSVAGIRRTALAVSRHDLPAFCYFSAVSRDVIPEFRMRLELE